MPRLRHRLTRRALLCSAALLAATNLPAQPARPTPPSTAPAPAPLAPGEIRLTYLGNAGWEITDGKRVILVDPFLTQFARWTPGAQADGPAPDALYPADTALINRHVSRADYILVTHGHPDHALDAGYIARRTGAVVIGHETAANLARAYAVPEQQLITVLGGEDYDFKDFSLRVIPNIHSALENKRYFNNGRGIAGKAPRGLVAPLRRRDYQEGGSLAYLLRLGGHEVLIMGSMNFIEREMDGLRPDIALVGANSQRLEIYDYTGRLMRALGQPALVIPSHADAYGDPNPNAAALADRAKFLDEVKKASPSSRTFMPTWFTPIVVPPRGKALPTQKDEAKKPTAAKTALSSGARHFDKSLALEDSGYTSASASVGDVNRDGHLDIVLVKGRHWPLPNLVLLGNGRGQYESPMAVDPVGDRSYSGILVDLDRDGSPDLVVSNDNPDAKKIYRNNGAGHFTLVTTFGRPEWNTRHVAVGDVNGDGIPDMALANRGSREPTASFLCLGKAGARVEEPCREISSGSATTITMADVNGDKSLDLIVPHRDGGQGYVLINDGHGAFPNRIPFGPAKATIRAAYSADFNGDGLTDLAAIDELGSALILRGLPGGQFAEAEPLGPANARPYAMTVHDVDGNGRPDVIVGYTNAQPYVYFNDGPGKFTPVVFGDAKGIVYGITVADLNEDGLMDIVMARSDAPNMVYFGSR